MLKDLFNKYLKLVLPYILILFIVFLKGERFFLTPIYYIIYLFTFILIRENYQLSKYNKDIVLIFSIFYFYLSFILLANFVVRLTQDSRWIYVIYFYTDILLTWIILSISLYLLFYALNLPQYFGYHKSIVLMLFLSLILTILNFYPILVVPSQVDLQYIWPIYSKKVYYFKAMSIFSLLVFWIFYYKKYFVLSEYLNLIIFLFMLSNILDALYYIGIQFQFSFFKYGQYFTLLTTVLFLVVWYIRLKYLKSDLAKENERYLENFLYLNGLVRKPKESFLQYLFSILPLNLLFIFFVILLGGVFIFYLTNKSTESFFLMLNVVFIVLTVFGALLISFLSIKREWQNQFRAFQKSRKR